MKRAVLDASVVLKWYLPDEGRGKPLRHTLPIPAQLIGGNGERLGAWYTLRPIAKGPVGPDVNLLNFSDRARYNVLACHGMRVVGAHATYADYGDVEELARRP